GRGVRAGQGLGPRADRRVLSSRARAGRRARASGSAHGCGTGRRRAGADFGGEPRRARQSGSPALGARGDGGARLGRHGRGASGRRARYAGRRPLRADRSRAERTAWTRGRRAPPRAVRAVLLPRMPDRTSLHARDFGRRRGRAGRGAPVGDLVTRLTVLHLAANRWWTGSADPIIHLVSGLRARGHRDRLGSTLYRRTAAVFAVSRVIESRCREAGIAPDRIFWIPGAVDLTRFTADADPTPIREEFKLGDAPVVVSVARLATNRGHELL